MAKSPEANLAQFSIPSYMTELVPSQLPAGIDPGSRVTLISLTDKLRAGLSFGPQPSFRDYRRTEVPYVESGLYIPKGGVDPDKNAEHVMWLGARNSDNPKPQEDLDKRGFGVAFQPVEFVVVARNARDLGRHAVVRTRRSRWEQPDRRATTAAAMRSAGHALVGKIQAMDTLANQLEGDSTVLRHLINHLIEPAKFRIKAKRLSTERALGVEKIHDTVEVSGIYQGLSNQQLAAQHRTIKRHIYSGNYSYAERTYHMIRYFRMVGVHNRAKLYKLGISRNMSQSELDSKYKPYLDEAAGTEHIRQVA